MANKEEFIYEINADISGLVKGIQEANEALETLGTDGRAGVEGTTEAIQQQTHSVNALRYQLYDVASTWRSVALGAGGFAAATTAASVAFERDFANVQRTSGAVGVELQNIRNELVQMTTEIPESFQTLTEIGTLGGQLGIASENITDLTEQVAMFTAVAGTGVQETVTAFGRLVQQTSATEEEFQNIGSAMYRVGINSVATEQQIMRVATEIGTAADLAGFTTQEIIGLSGALASLGVQPERARGNIQRIFSDISMHVATGTEQLDLFAKLSNTTANEFATSWRTAPEQAFRGVLNGLNNVIETGGDLDIVLRELGFNNVRDLQTWKQLANNVDLYAQVMNDALLGFAEGGDLLEGYGIVADTLAKRITVLGQTIMAIADEVGSSLGPVLKPALDLLQSLAETALAFVQTPIGTGFSAVTLAVAGFVAALAAAQAMSALVRASFLALSESEKTLAQSSQFADVNLKTLLATLGRVSGVLKSVPADATRAAAGIQSLGTSAQTASSRIGGLGLNVGGLGKMLSRGLGGFAVVGGISIAMSLATKAIEAWQKSTMTAQEKAEAFYGSLVPLQQAMIEDGKIYEESAGKIGTFVASVETADAETKNAVQGLEDWSNILGTSSGSQQDLKEATDEATGAIQRQTLAIGENVQIAIAQMILGNEDLKNIFLEQRDVLEGAGINLEEFFQRLATADPALLAEDISVFKDRLEEIASAMANLNAGITEDAFAEMFPDLPGNISDLRDMYDALNHFIDVAEATGGMVEGVAENFDYTSFAAKALGIDLKDLGYDAEGAGDGFRSLADEARALADAFFEADNAEIALNQALSGMASSLYENAFAFDTFSAAGQANMQAVQGALTQAVASAGGDASALAQHLSGIIAWLSQFGAATGPVIQYIRDFAAAQGVAIGGLDLMSQAAMNAQRALGTGYAGAADKAARSSRGAGRAARSAAKEIRTLSDYVKDLQSVMSSAFEFRFGLEIAQDSVAEATSRLKELAQTARDDLVKALENVGKAQDNILKIRESIESSRDSIRGIRADLQGLAADMGLLRADQATLEYHLTVAQEYGDTLRATQIAAELEKIQADLAKVEADRKKAINDLQKAERDLTKEQQNLVSAGGDLRDANKDVATAQANLKRDLSGTTASSREQRDAVRRLIEAYQDQIAELANTGMSQAQLQRETARLKREFEDQLRQLGYNRAEVQRYAKAFDDMSVAIQRVPRNITINANLGPAERAIAEFIAKNTKGRGLSGAGASMSPSIGSSFNDQAYRRAARAAQLGATIASYLGMIQRNPTHVSVNSWKASLDYYANLLRSGSYAQGGFTGQGDKYEPAGIVHKGEYVLPKSMVNQSTGTPKPEALARLMAGASPTQNLVRPSVSVSAPSVTQVELGPQTMATLAAAQNVTLVLNGRELNSQLAKTSHATNILSGVR